MWLCTTDIWPCVTNSWTAVIYLTPCRFKYRARSQTLNRGAMRSDLLVFNERNKATLSAWVTLSLCVFSFKLWYLLGRSLNLDLPMLLSLRNFCFLGGAYIGPNMDDRDDLVICNTKFLSWLTRPNIGPIWSTSRQCILIFVFAFVLWHNWCNLKPYRAIVDEISKNHWLTLQYGSKRC